MANSMLQGDVEWRWRGRSELEGRWSGGQAKMDTYALVNRGYPSNLVTKQIRRASSHTQPTGSNHPVPS